MRAALVGEAQTVELRNQQDKKIRACILLELREGINRARQAVVDHVLHDEAEFGFRRLRRARVALVLVVDEVALEALAGARWLQRRRGGCRRAIDRLIR